jgi:cyclopropane fatty-acyl-phospholipid synthase-like methyltransferase
LSFFDLVYESERVPPWDIGRPQGEIVRLARTKQFTGSVLDLGCGTGENALYLASLGHETWGIDSSPYAIEKAKKKAQERHLKVTLLVRDALEVGDLGRTFDNVIDTGLFHIFSDEERPLYALTIASVLRPSGKYHMLCFSDHETDPQGPRPVTRKKIRATFRHGWKINYIRAARFEDNIHMDGAYAWLSSITRK